MKKRMELYMAVLLLVAVCLLSKEGAVLVSSMRAAEEKPCIVVEDIFTIVWKNGS